MTQSRTLKWARTAGVIVLAFYLLGRVAGWDDDSSEAPQAKPASVASRSPYVPISKLKGYGEGEFLKGTITRIESYYSRVTVEIDGDEFDLADVEAFWDLDCGDLYEPEKKALSTVKRVIPVGTKVVGVRSDDVVFLRKANATMWQPSLNETLIRKGVGAPSSTFDPYEDGAADKLAQRLHRADLVAAGAAKKDRVGTYARCDRAEARSQREMRRIEREIESEVPDVPSTDLPGDGYCDSCHYARKYGGRVLRHLF